MTTAPRDLVIGTAGHIDHGKTALVRALTGVDTDRLPAEKARGITIDLGFASLALGDVHLALIDVPGHERFIRNMLAGATGLDLALLVIAADDSVMPQTREHLEILKLLGLTGGLVALTKCDLADPAWLAMVEEDARELVKGSFLEGAPIVRTSANTGEGVAELREALRALGRSSQVRADPGHFRLAIDRSFTVAGHGTVVTGTVASGSAAVGDELEWLPEGRPVRVRGLQRHDHPVKRACRGMRVALNVAGVHHAEIRRGQELASPGYLRPSRVLSVRILASEASPRPLRHRARYKLHLGTAEVNATLALFEGAEARPGLPALGQLFTSEPVVAVSGQPFILRAESPPATLGGGVVLTAAARRIRRRDHAEIARAAGLASKDPIERAASALAGFGLAPWTDRDLCREAAVSALEVEGVVGLLREAGRLLELPIGPRRRLRLPAAFVASLETRLLRALGRLHEAHPRQTAIPRSHLSSELADLGSDALVASLVDRLRGRGEVIVEGRLVALKGHEPQLSQGERKLKSELADKIQAGGFSPPDLQELTAHAGAKSKVVPELLALLRDEERIVEIAPAISLDFDKAAELRRMVLERLSDGSALTMADIRDLLGTTRKFAVPIGEYLDRAGLTVREGDQRRLAPGASFPGDAGSEPTQDH